MKQEIWFEDCLDAMKNIEDKSVDLVLCDLPYGTTACSWDVIIPFEELWKNYYRICKPTTPIVLFGTEPFSSHLRLSNLKHYKYDWIWEKERFTNILQVKRRPGRITEQISVFYQEQCKYFPQMIQSTIIRKNIVLNGSLGKLIDSGNKKVHNYKDTGLRYPANILKFNRDVMKINGTLHPTQKPLALCEYLIKTYTQENDLVLDNCSGSGTVCLAAKNLNRQFIGIEKNKEYYDISIQRVFHDLKILPRNQIIANEKKAKRQKDKEQQINE